MEPIEIECSSCGCDFEFTIEEQMAYWRKGFDAPKWCPECRRNRTRVKSYERTRRNRNKEIDWAQMSL